MNDTEKNTNISLINFNIQDIDTVINILNDMYIRGSEAWKLASAINILRQNGKK